MSLDYGADDFGSYKQTISYYVGKGFEEMDVAKAIRSGVDDMEIVDGTIYSKCEFCVPPVLSIRARSKRKSMPHTKRALDQ